VQAPIDSEELAVRSYMGNGESRMRMWLECHAESCRSERGYVCARPMRQEPVSAERFADLLPAPPRVSEAYSTFSILVVDSTPLQASAEFSDHALGLFVRGRHRFCRQMGGRSVKGWSDPGNLLLHPAGLRGSWSASGSSRGITLLLPVAFVSRVITEHWEIDPNRVEVVPQFLFRDPVIEGITTRLAWEAQNGSPSGRMYADSACEFLAHHIICSYSSLSIPPPRVSGGLRGDRLKLVVDYIHDNLAQPITLWHLANIAGVTVRHFERAFRQATSVPPHAYILQKRLDLARELLLNRPLISIQDIAAQTGFSSSAHLASAFRRQTGYSPSTFRRIT
jgi:AraC family transcriptional regulator